MKNKGIQYKFTATPWRHASPGGWYFVSLPVETAKEIRSLLRFEEEGWGRLKATAKIGNTEWDTAIWFDTKINTYLLPLKADTRKKENISTNGSVKIILWV